MLTKFGSYIGPNYTQGIAMVKSNPKRMVEVFDHAPDRIVGFPAWEQRALSKGCSIELCRITGYFIAAKNGEPMGAFPGNKAAFFNSVRANDGKMRVRTGWLLV